MNCTCAQQGHRPPDSNALETAVPSQFLGRLNHSAPVVAQRRVCERDCPQATSCNCRSSTVSSPTAPENLLDLHNRDFDHLVKELQLENLCGVQDSRDHEDRLRHKGDVDDLDSRDSATAPGESLWSAAQFALHVSEGQQENQHSVDELKPGHPKEIGSRLAEAVDDNSLGELYNSLQGLRVPSLQSALTQTTLVVRVFLLAVGKRSLWDASPGVMSQPPVSLGRFSGRRPCARSAIARWQEATDPQSPKGGSQRACPLGVPTLRLLGVDKEWR